ncbi:hypothetical protein ACIPVK_00080 [Paeniglutamicibacter sp. MACA_103]|uniref:hypothetical protein n=1 Tax=Paeniglutamicibacter sp. MACA_103 TaxID=3377337 RepID=UPI003896250D
MLLRDRLPEALGDHWGMGGTIHGTVSLPQSMWGGVVAIVVLCGMASLGLLPPSRGKTEAGPLLLGICTGSAVVVAGMMLAAGLAWGMDSALLLNASAPDAPLAALGNEATDSGPHD